MKKLSVTPEGKEKLTCDPPRQVINIHAEIENFIIKISNNDFKQFAYLNQYRDLNYY